MSPQDQRQVLNAEDLEVVTGIPARTIRRRTSDQGHFLGVRPIPDTGKRVLFSRVLIERALHGDQGAVAS